MRISDWSSDVCSSDLTKRNYHGRGPAMDALYLNAAEIFHAAAEESGLSAYSDPALEERFHYLTGLFNAFGKIPVSDYPTAVDQMKSTVIKGLQVARDWKDQTEILEVEIVQPFL